MSLSAAFAPLALFNFGGSELLIVLLIILVLFGGAKLPSLARGLGQSIKEFKKASHEEDAEGKTGTPPEAGAASESKKAEPANTPHGSN
ncbi:MAG: twin-arginine translocase TatA/TatE family subunit [Opitutaceae bacterium]